uniref:PAS domain-containing protein n=1 Tax=Eptatretus burgeri TaxID=7764 RepID=A0A8C4WZ49_EPTBU
LEGLSNHSERRKQRSCDAARRRRSQEVEVFLQLAQALPIPTKTSRVFDKTTIVRLSNLFFPLLCLLDGEMELPKTSIDPLCLETLDGFLLMLTWAGDVMFASETIVKYTGFSQVCIYVLHCMGHAKAVQKAVHEVGCRSCLLILCCPIQHPVNLETPLDPYSFLSHHNPDMCLTYIDKRVAGLLGYEPAELMGRSMYEFYHAFDSEHIARCHRQRMLCNLRKVLLA